MPEYTMMDYIEGKIPLTPEQERAREDTYAHAGMVSDRLKKEGGMDQKPKYPEIKEATKPEVVNCTTGGRSLKGDVLMSDKEILTNLMGYTDEEADQIKLSFAEKKISEVPDIERRTFYIDVPEYQGREFLKRMKEEFTQKKERDDAITQANADLHKGTSKWGVRTPEEDKKEIERLVRDLEKRRLVKEEWKPIMRHITGVMTFYFNVGQLSPDRAEDYIEKQKNKLNEGDKFIDRLKSQGIDVLFLPVRDQDTRVEYIKL